MIIKFSKLAIIWFFTLLILATVEYAFINTAYQCIESNWGVGGFGWFMVGTGCFLVLIAISFALAAIADLCRLTRSTLKGEE